VVYKNILGRLLLKDSIRQESKPVLERLESMGIHTVMLTGDRRSAAQSVGESLGIKEVRSGLKPEDKVAAVHGFAEEGKKVAMVGDGVNDAPCLAAAYVAVAMGGRGSDAALEQSEIVLMNDRIDNFLKAYCLSRRAKRIIRQNLAISLGTIAIMVSAAVFGLVPLTLGVFAHEGSTALVCLNSLRLLVFGRNRDAGCC
jgi:Cd2+/Zn2+-exporting ATPase